MVRTRVIVIEITKDISYTNGEELYHKIIDLLEREGLKPHHDFGGHYYTRGEMDKEGV